MRTTSSWPPRLTAYSLGRPRRERVLVVLQLAPLFRCLTQIKVNVQPVCDVLLAASQRHSLRSKQAEKKEFLRASKDSSIRRVAGLHRAPLHERVGRRFAGRRGVSSLPL